MGKAKPAEEKARRRLYSLYPEQIQKLTELAALSNIPQSEYLRQLIDVAHAEKCQRETRYSSGPRCLE